VAGWHQQIKKVSLWDLVFNDDAHRWTDNDEDEPKDAEEGTDVNPIGNLLYPDEDEETKDDKKRF
jgi:hypothetical protein